MKINHLYLLRKCLWNYPSTFLAIRCRRPDWSFCDCDCMGRSFSSANLPDQSINLSSDNQEKIERKSVKEILNSNGVDDLVRVQGWVRSVRKQKKNVFFDIGDGSTFHKIPVVCATASTPKELSMHSSVDVTGVLASSPKNPTLLEIHPSSPVEVIGKCDQLDYPFGGKIRYEPDYIRQYLHLRAKTNKFSSLLRIRSAATRAVSNFFYENGFHQVHTPILTSNDCEGAGEVFLVRPANENLMLEKPNVIPTRVPNVANQHKVQTHAHEDLPFDGVKYTHSHSCQVCGTVFEHTHSKKPLEVSQKYDNHYCEDHKGHIKSSVSKPNPDEAFFDCKTFLTVSSQLHLEAMANGLDKVWTLSPAFRSENTKSTRHLSEFYMLEAEMAFLNEISPLLKTMENLVKHVIRSVLYENSTEWAFYTESNLELQKMLDKILKTPFTIMSFKEASDLLMSKANSEVLPQHGLNREQELLLVEKLNDGIPIFVIEWPTDIKPFYVRQNPRDPSLCSGVDLLVPEVGELIGGSLREHDLSRLMYRSREADTTGKLQESLGWYFDLRKYGGVPTGGFGLGFDRLIQLLVGSNNIKDVNPFPRWPHNCPM